MSQIFKLRTNICNKSSKQTAASAAQLAMYILRHAYSRTTAAPNCASTNKNFILQVIDEMAFFGCKLRTDLEQL